MRKIGTIIIAVLAIVAFGGSFASAGEFGRSFNEAGFTLGGYGNSQDLRGAYVMLEANRWQEQVGADRNWSLLGGLVMYEPGDVNDYKWKKFKVLYQPGIYQSLNNQGTWHLLLKPRIGYFFDRGTQEDEGLAYGGVCEVIKTLTLNKLGLTLDLMFESREQGKDGYVACRPFYERTWPDGKSIKVSVGPIFHYTPDTTETSICPSISMRIPINGDFSLNFGLSADFGKEAETYGLFVSMSWNDIRYVFKERKE